MRVLRADLSPHPTLSQRERAFTNNSLNGKSISESQNAFHQRQLLRISRGRLFRLLAAGKVAAAARLLPACSQLLFLRALESPVSGAAISALDF